MIKTPRQALDFIRKHGVVVMTRHPGRISFVETVVGAPVRGSWWGHKQGKLIFALADSLRDSSEILALKLIDGKVTFVHRTRWAALARFVTDPDRRKAALRCLSPDAGVLLRLVDRRGCVRLDQADVKGRKELESGLLVHSGSMHTEKGAHAAVLTSWSRIFGGETSSEASQLTMDEAKVLLTF